MASIALVVEEYGSHENYTLIMRRVSRLRQAGIPLIWLIDNDERMVTVFGLEEPFQLCAENEELSGGEALPGLRCNVSDILRPVDASLRSNESAAE